MFDLNPIKSIRESAGMRFAVLFGSFFILLLLTSVIGSVIEGSGIGSVRDRMLGISAIQSLLAFIVPAIILAKYSSDNVVKWLRLDSPLRIKPLIGVVLVYFLSLPAMEWLIDWNANIHFPETLAGLEEILRNWEDTNGAAADVLTNTHGFWPVLTGVLVIGVLTGFAEELFFRGGLQGILVRSNKMGSTASIWMAAFIFSSMHFQFFGFVPRLLMGVFFGYLLVWSGDIKVSAFAHILNNSIVVIVAGIFGSESIVNPEVTLVPDLPYMPIASVTATVIFFLFFRGYFFYKNNKSALPWQKNPQPSVSES